MANIAFDIVTPEALVSSEKVEMVVIPGEDGDFGVMEGHSPMISNLRPGVLRVFDGDKIVKRLLVTEGVVEVTQERCAVMTHEAFDMADTSLDAMRKRYEALKDVHDKAAEAEREAAKNNMNVAEMLVEAFVRENDTL